MVEDYEIPKKLLELNRKHTIVANLARILASQPDADLIDVTILQLFNNALLLEGWHPKPAEMVEQIQSLMEAAVVSQTSHTAG
jgi:molecular chaperone HtpG